jgi:hypothetical protein
MLTKLFLLDTEVVQVFHMRKARRLSHKICTQGECRRTW